MKMLINNEYFGKDDVLDVMNPFTCQAIDEIHVASRDDVKIAIKSAKMAKESINNMSAIEISESLYSSYETLKKEKKNITKLITQETGKPIKEAIDEIDYALEILKFSAEESKRIYGETIPLDIEVEGKEFFGFTLKVPCGVMAGITPFNFPISLAIGKIAPALAAKNSVIIKPATNAPLSCLRLIEIINEEFPPGVVNSVTGHGNEAGDELIVNDNVDKISFTGSVPIGLSIPKKAGLKKITLELGGNDPLIVLEDADVKKAVKAAMIGSYSYSGQICTAIKRIILNNEIADEFMDLFIKETSKLKMGDPSKQDTDIGPLITENAAKSVEKSVLDACDKGAELILGGNREGNFFEPTILDNLTLDNDAVNNEIFGPISPIFRVNNTEEAIKIANGTKYGLQATVFTENIHNGFECARDIDAGSVFINNESSFITVNMPFGGFKLSGIGKEGVKYAIESMTKTKLMSFNTD